MNNKEVVVAIEGLKKNFIVDKKVIYVLKEIDVKIYAGEFIILFGPSGSGKTTLLNMIAGLDRVSSGRVSVFGRHIVKFNNDELSAHRSTNIGMVFQDFNLIPAMTAVENVSLPLAFSGVGYKKRTARAKALLRDMGLGDRLVHKPIEMSGGQQQRVAIARSLINNPSIMLIDEPTGNLDSESAHEIMKIIIKLNKESKRTIVLVTHNPNYLGLADRVFWIQDGKIVNERQNIQ
jgi:putative ABC transport system ATP-binding protein